MAVENFQTMYQYAARHWGKANATGDDLALVKALVNTAYFRSLQRHTWKFLNRQYLLSFVADKNAYQLPSDFNRIVTDEIPYTTVEPVKVIKRRDISLIRRLRVENDSTNQPRIFDVIASNYSLETGSSWKLEVYPTPDASYTGIVYYRFNPGKLVDDGHIIAGHQAFYNLVMQEILASIELEEDEKVGPQNAVIPDLLASAIQEDNASEPDSLGSYLNNSIRVSGQHLTGESTYYNTFGS